MGGGCVGALPNLLPRCPGAAALHGPLVPLSAALTCGGYGRTGHEPGARSGDGECGAGLQGPYPSLRPGRWDEVPASCPARAGSGVSGPPGVSWMRTAAEGGAPDRLLRPDSLRGGRGVQGDL